MATITHHANLEMLNSRNVKILMLYPMMRTGLFAYSHMDFEADRDKSPKGDPSLAEMTKKALSILQKNKKGFFLLVESGRIDHAHHYNNPYRALDETLVLEEALLAVLEAVDQSETLIVVTSDHSHVLTMGGLATPRGNPIFGKFIPI
uniref:alkaline phosphatase n=1 Tax=Rhodnius prolixus TaxID=13249 RepID=T1HAQ9_RHOPR